MGRVIYMLSTWICFVFSCVEMALTLDVGDLYGPILWMSCRAFRASGEEIQS